MADTNPAAHDIALHRVLASLSIVTNTCTLYHLITTHTHLAVMRKKPRASDPAAQIAVSVRLHLLRGSPGACVVQSLGGVLCVTSVVTLLSGPCQAPNLVGAQVAVRG